jgi:Methyladenine glycosylase
MGTSYCDIAPTHEWHGPFHEAEYGFPLKDDAALFERLVLEINQAGLSWLTILKKREAFRRTYDGSTPRSSPGIVRGTAGGSSRIPASCATASRSRRRSRMQPASSWGSF